mmetsp:Transcript_4146/g.8778  ORF Transcript_4146/g.8778 Transcript_4146/m.8778 type:complete len:312 (+) Transcript_4146:1-936(+)
MGGDGILNEIMQGIRSRPQHDQEQILSSIKFGIVGCGTSNGLAKSILHWSGEEYGALESIFQICKGVVATLDIATYALLPKHEKKGVVNGVNNDESDTLAVQKMRQTQQSNVKYITSFLSFSWGLIADCDLESECLRILGTLRSDIWAVYRGVLFPRRYRARFSYLPPRVNNGDEVCEQDSSFDMPKFVEEVPEGWVSVEDDFTVFWACQTSHASYNMFNCPMSKMNDGLFHILVVRASCPRWRLILMLLQLESGNHIHCKGLEVISCRAYRLEPLSYNSYNDIDGELVEDGVIQAHMMPRGAQFFAGKVD